MNKKKIKLFLSGGIDSEAMAEAFLHAGVAFEVMIGRYNQHMNSHDICTAFEFCERKNITSSVIDVDVIQFLESGEYLHYVEKYGCRSPQLATHMKLLDLAGDGVFVMAGNPMLPVFRKGIEEELNSADIYTVFGMPGQTQSTYYRYFETTKNSGTPYFFQSTPELIQAFFKNEYLLKMMSHRADKMSYLDKCAIYSASGFKAQPRQDKYTGFERYKTYYEEQFKIDGRDKFNQLFRKPLEIAFPELPHLVQIDLVPEVIGKLNQNNKRNKNVERRALLRSFAAVAGVLTLAQPAFALNWCCAPEGCMAGEPGCSCWSQPGKC